MPANQLLIFAKSPRQGECKTRLAKDIGDQAALAAYVELAEKTLRTVATVAAKRMLLSTEVNPITHAWAALADAALGFQSAGDLGQRMCSAMNAAFEQDAERVVLIGVDSPVLSQHYIEMAFRHLEHHDLVLGPVEDGGYVLIGLRRPMPQLFTNIEWSTERVLRQTLAASQGASAVVLETLWDVDELADWTRYLEQVSD